MSVKAAVTNISRGSLHDGPGVRTVVYLKGCSLRCRWCHNPETFFRTAEVLYAPMKCIGCGREVMLERVKVEKNIKKIIREEQ